MVAPINGSTYMLLEETTKMKASPQTVYHFFENMDDQYKQWHPDHNAFRWIDGGSLEEGSKAYFEEDIGGKTQKKTVRFTRIDPDRYIEFRPTSRVVGFLMPHISFTITPCSDGCEVTQRIKVRTGPIGARLNRREFDAVRKHMHEEGTNLKHILETDE